MTVNYTYNTVFTETYALTFELKFQEQLAILMR